MKSAIYWAILTPEDGGQPEMFFRTEEWARTALDDARLTAPAWLVAQIRLVRVRATIEVLES